MNSVSWFVLCLWFLVGYGLFYQAYGKHTGKGIPTYVLASPKRYRRPKPYHEPYDHHHGDHPKPYDDDHHHGICKSYHEHFYSSPCDLDPKPPIKKWKCHSIPNSYPDCEASKKKLCLPMTCKDQVWSCFEKSFNVLALSRLK